MLIEVIIAMVLLGLSLQAWLGIAQVSLNGLDQGLRETQLLGLAQEIRQIQALGPPTSAEREVWQRRLKSIDPTQSIELVDDGMGGLMLIDLASDQAIWSVRQTL